jgi:hypothetical protein
MEEIIYYVLSNLVPIRGIFNGNFLILIVGAIIPFLLGILISLFFLKKIRLFREYFQYLIRGVVPFIFIFILLFCYFHFQNLSIEIAYPLSYYFFYFLVLFSLGFGSIPLLKIKEGVFVGKIIQNSKLIFLILLVTLFLVFILNLIPFFNSEFLVGADVYYASSRIQLVMTSGNILESPFFKGVMDMNYPPLYFIISSFFIRVLNISVQTYLFIFSSIYSVLFLISLFYFVKKIFSSNTVALFSVIFASVWDKIIFPGIGPKNLALIFLSLFLIFLSLKKGKLRTFLILFSLVLTFLTHYLYFFSELLILFFIFIVSKFNWRFPLSPSGEEKARKEDYGILVLFFLLVLLSFFLIYSILNLPDVNSKHLLVNLYPEIPIAFFNRVGLMSIFSFIFFPISFLIFIKSRIDIEKKLILSGVLLLLLNSLFYYLNLFTFHFSILSEIAFVFGVLPIFSYFIYFLLTNLRKEYRILLVLILFIFLALTLSIQLEYSLNYSKGIDNLISDFSDEFQSIRENTPPGSIILTDPCDFIVRYIPHYTQRYVFSGEYTGKGNCSRRVLTFCGSDVFGVYDCDLRNNISYNFLYSSDNFPGDVIPKGFDFIFLSKMDNYLENKSYVRLINQTEHYFLYKYEKSFEGGGF